MRSMRGVKVPCNRYQRIGWQSFSTPECLVMDCGSHQHGIPPPSLWHYQPTCWRPLPPDLAGGCSTCGELEPVPAALESEQPASDQLQAPPASTPSSEPTGRDSDQPPAAPAPGTVQPAGSAHGQSVTWPVGLAVCAGCGPGRRPLTAPVDLTNSRREIASGVLQELPDALRFPAPLQID